MFIERKRSQLTILAPNVGGLEISLLCINSN